MVIRPEGISLQHDYNYGSHYGNRLASLALARLHRMLKQRDTKEQVTHSYDSPNFHASLCPSAHKIRFFP